MGRPAHPLGDERWALAESGVATHPAWLTDERHSQTGRAGSGWCVSGGAAATGGDLGLSSHGGSAHTRRRQSRIAFAASTSAVTSG